MKKVIYTVITNQYDNLIKIPNFKGWDKIAFIDTNINDSKGWEVRQIEKSDNPIQQSRDYKIRSHIYLYNYDLVCYIDGNQLLLKEPPSSPIFFRHTRRKNIFEEAKQLIINGRFSAEYINPQIKYYKDQGFNENGLYLNGFFVRDHSPEINTLHEIWYAETLRFTPRDQLTLPYAIYKTGIKPKNIVDEKIRHTYSKVIANTGSGSSNNVRGHTMIYKP